MRTVATKVLALVARKATAGETLTVVEAEKATGASRKSVRLALKHWKAQDAIHLAAYRAVRGGFEACWALGSGKDAPEPDRISRSKASCERRMAYAREQRVAQMLSRDQRSGLDLWACPNLGALPMIPYARPA